MTTQAHTSPCFKDTPLTLIKGILMFPDTRNYIGAEYPGLIQRMEKVVNDYDANQALIAEQAAEIFRLQAALDKIVNIGLVDQADALTRLNECRDISRLALAQEVGK